MRKIKETIKNIGEIDYRMRKMAQTRLNNLTKPRGSFGRLEELAKLITGITAEDKPQLEDKVIFTLAADHGVTEERVSAYPKEVTAQMVYNFLKGGAGINVLANHIGARVIVVDMGVATDLTPQPKLIIRKINYGTCNMAKGPAMTREEAVKSIESGIEILEEELKNGIDIIGVGEMGIGNTTAASAITACFTKKEVEEVTGSGTGIGTEALRNKIRVIKEVLKINCPDPNDPIDVLTKIGGFEIGGLAGVILAAAAKRIPIVIDGFISSAAALVAYYLEPKVRDYMIASHLSAEKGHRG